MAANLALALAEKHKRVLLVDADLRKPSQHKVFELQGDDTRSFSRALQGEMDWKETVEYNRKSHLWMLFQFAQAKDPGGALRDVRMRQLLTEWKGQMDYIIVDCSPISASADAEIWMAAVDSVLLVVREDWADVRLVNDSVDIVRQSHTDFSGFVLNGFHKEWSSKHNGYQYEEYESYSHGGGVEDTREGLKYGRNKT